MIITLVAVWRINLREQDGEQVDQEMQCLKYITGCWHEEKGTDSVNVREVKLVWVDKIKGFYPLCSANLAYGRCIFLLLSWQKEQVITW